MTSDVFDIRDRVIVVTGGVGQLGRQMALAMVDRDAKVAVFDPQATNEVVTKRFGDRQNDTRLSFHTVDVTKRESLERGLSEVQDKWGTPFGLVNNAALDSPPNAPAEENGPFESYPESSWDRVMEVNVKGVFLSSQVIGGAMAQRGRGSIVNICSIYGIVSPDQGLYTYRKEIDGHPFFKPIAYSASKSALLNMTRYLATYWANQGVRVNSVTLAGVFNKQDDSFLARYCQKVPLARMAREDEYNGGIIFLMSDAASYMTGSNLVMDGGFTAW